MVPTGWRHGSHGTNVHESLAGTLPERPISLKGDLQWPARSPDLAPCDYSLWDYFKSLVYTNRPRTLGQLKDNIRAAIADIGIDILEKVDRNVKIRLSQCIDEGGGHLRNVVFKT